MPRSAPRSSKSPEADVPKEPPPRKKISLVQIRAEDVLPGDIVWLAQGPRAGAWRKVSASVVQSGEAARVDIPFEGIGGRQTVNYGPYDLIKLQIEKDL